MTVCYDFPRINGSVDRGSIPNVVKCCLGKNGIHCWTIRDGKNWDFFLRFDEYDNIRIFD